MGKKWFPLLFLIVSSKQRYIEKNTFSGVFVNPLCSICTLCMQTPNSGEEKFCTAFPLSRWKLDILTKNIHPSELVFCNCAIIWERFRVENISPFFFFSMWLKFAVLMVKKTIHNEVNTVCKRKCKGGKRYQANSMQYFDILLFCCRSLVCVVGWQDVFDFYFSRKRQKFVVHCWVVTTFTFLTNINSEELGLNTFRDFYMAAFGYK